MVFAFSFHVPTVGAQPLGFATLQPFVVYPCQEYVPSGDGP